MGDSVGAVIDINTDRSVKSLGKLDKGFSNMDSKMDNMGKRLGKVESGMGQRGPRAASKFVSGLKMVIITVAALLPLLAGLAIGFGGAAILKAGSSAEQSLTKLTTSLGSAAKATQTYAWAVNIANRTPFETGDVVDAVARLSAYNVNAQQMVDAAEGQISVFEVLGNVASSMGRSIEQSTEAYADAIMGEWERMKEFGIKKSMVEGLDGIEAGTAAYAQAILTFLGNQQRFQGGMARMSETMSGLWSTIMGMSKQLLTEVAGVTDPNGFFGQVKNTMADFRDFLTANNDKLVAVARSFGLVLGQVWQHADRFINNRLLPLLQNAIDASYRWAVRIKDNFFPLATTIALVYEFVRRRIELVKKQWDEFWEGDTGQQLAANWASFGQEMKELTASTVSDMKTEFSKLKSVYEEDGVIAALGVAWEDTVKAIKASSLDEHWAGIETGAQAANWASFGQEMKELTASTVSDMKTEFSKLKSVYEEDGVIAALGVAWEDTVKAIKASSLDEHWAGIEKGAQSAWAKTKEVTGDIWTWINTPQDTPTTLKGKVAQGVHSFLEGAMVGVGTASDTLQRAWDNAKGSFKDLREFLGDDFNLASGWDDSQTLLRNLGELVVGFTAGRVANVVELLSSITKGFTTEIKKDTLTSFIGEISAAITATKLFFSTLGITSIQEFGVKLGKGIANAIPGVLKFVTNLMFGLNVMVLMVKQIKNLFLSFEIGILEMEQRMGSTALGKKLFPNMTANAVDNLASLYPVRAQRRDEMDVLLDNLVDNARQISLNRGGDGHTNMEVWANRLRGNSDRPIQLNVYPSPGTDEEEFAQKVVRVIRSSEEDADTESLRVGVPSPVRPVGNVLDNIRVQPLFQTP